MTDNQQKLFTLLCEVDDICRNNDITYYLAAGCALGAVRHGGFLPWDDDIDLYITRDNWEKLKTVICECLPDNRNFVCEEMTDLYDNPIGRYVDKETTQIMMSQVLCGECCGLFLEFFIMDPMPKGEDAEKEHLRYMRVYTELLSPYFLFAKNIYSPDQDFDYDLYCKYEKKAEAEGLSAVLDELKGKFTCIPEESAEKYCMRWGQKRWVFDAKFFGEPLYISFEGRQFPTLNYPHEYCRWCYGDDWMYIPTEVNQISHNFSMDLSRPYQEYVDLYMPLLNRDEIYKAYRKRKKKQMHSLVEKETALYSFNKLKATIVGEVIKDNMPDIEALRNQLRKNNYDVVNKELGFYYENQFDKSIMTDNLYIDVGDEFLSVALENLTLQGFYFRAAKILKLRKNSSADSFSVSLKEAEEHIKFCRNLSIAITDISDADKVTQLLKDHFGYKDTLDYQVAFLWLMRFHCKTDDDARSIIRQADKAIDSFGDNGDLIRYRAWALHELGDLEAPLEYMNAVNHTRNGFVWKEAKDMYGIEPYEVTEDER